MKLEITENPSLEDDDLVINNLRKYNSEFAANKYKLLSCYFRNSDDEIIAGLTGKTYWNWLHIEHLWVDENGRGSKLGTQLVLAAEEEAKLRGCVGSTLDTFSFQALDFYKKLGYEVLGTLDNYSNNHQRYYLHKKL